jgi:catechol 2,3-dioxygenase-like lactoylglutathione lyase family enzyme
VEILGLVFVGTASAQHDTMAEFCREVLGMTIAHDAGVTGDLFELPDDSRFAVVEEWEPGVAGRTIGFLVRDVGAAAAELRAAGVATDAVQENDRQRYVHFTAPDGRLYELVEEKGRA